MSSPLRIYYSQPAPDETEEPELPESSAFHKALRAIAQKQQAVSLNPAQLAVVPEPKGKRARAIGSPLTKGGSAALVEPTPAEEEVVASPAAVEEPKQPKPAQRGMLVRAWSWLQKNNKFAAVKQLRVSETVSLGEKRFVALVDIDGQKFLIGGGSSGVSLLTALSTNESTAETMQQAAASAGQLK
jgi:Flagellar biosynthesis protein, FliO